MALTTIDVVLARYVLAPVESGEYALISTLGRSPIWVTQFLALALIPTLATSGSRRSILRAGGLVLGRVPRRHGGGRDGAGALDRPARRVAVPRRRGPAAPLPRARNAPRPGPGPRHGRDGAGSTPPGQGRLAGRPPRSGPLPDLRARQCVPRPRRGHRGLESRRRRRCRRAAAGHPAGAGAAWRWNDVRTAPGRLAPRSDATHESWSGPRTGPRPSSPSSSQADSEPAWARWPTDRPKHLLEVAGEPFIVHQLRWLASHGVVDVVLATSHLADQFEPVLGDGSRWGVRLRYSTEPHPAGTAGGLRAAAGTLASLPERVVVVNGDLLTPHDLTRQLTLGADTPTADAVLHLREVGDARSFGSVVADSGGRVSSFLEKTSAPPSLEVNAGTYVLGRSLVESIPDGIVSLEKDVLPRFVARGAVVVAYREDALWEDVGSPEALVRASRALVLRSGRDAHIDPTALVDATAQVAGGSAVGPRARRRGRCRGAGLGGHDRGRRRSRSPVEDSAVGPGRRVERGEVLRGESVASRRRHPPEAGRSRRPAAPVRHPGRHRATTRRRAAPGTATTSTDGAGFARTSCGLTSPHRERLPTTHATGASTMATSDSRSRVRGAGARMRHHRATPAPATSPGRAANTPHPSTKATSHPTRVHADAAGYRSPGAPRASAPTAHGHRATSGDQEKPGGEEDGAARGRHRDVGGSLWGVLDVEDVRAEVPHPPAHGIAVHDDRWPRAAHRPSWRATPDGRSAPRRGGTASRLSRSRPGRTRRTSGRRRRRAPARRADAVSPWLSRRTSESVVHPGRLRSRWSPGPSRNGSQPATRRCPSPSTPPTRRTRTGSPSIVPMVTHRCAAVAGSLDTRAPSRPTSLTTGKPSPSWAVTWRRTVVAACLRQWRPRRARGSASVVATRRPSTKMSASEIQPVAFSGCSTTTRDSVRSSSNEASSHSPSIARPGTQPVLRVAVECPRATDRRTAERPRRRRRDDVPGDPLQRVQDVVRGAAVRPDQSVDPVLAGVGRGEVAVQPRLLVVIGCRGAEHPAQNDVRRRLPEPGSRRPGERLHRLRAWTRAAEPRAGPAARARPPRRWRRGCRPHPRRRSP